MKTRTPAKHLSAYGFIEHIDVTDLAAGTGARTPAGLAMESSSCLFGHAAVVPRA
jgi:hypothetical protein